MHLLTKVLAICHHCCEDSTWHGSLALLLEHSLAIAAPVASSCIWTVRVPGSAGILHAGAVDPASGTMPFLVPAPLGSARLFCAGATDHISSAMLLPIQVPCHSC